MPTDPQSRYWRHLVTGDYEEGPDYGQSRPDGCHDWLLIGTLGGRGVVEHDEGAFTVRRGDLVLLAPRRRHEYRTDPAAGHWKLLWAHFIPEPEWTDLLRWPARGPGAMHLRAAGARQWRPIVERLRATHRLATSYARRRERLAINALEAVLLLCAELHVGEGEAVTDPRIIDVLDHAHRSLAGDLSIAALSAHAGLSPSRFSHLFEEQVGVSPQRYVEQARMARARWLLERTTQSVRRVAAEVGYTDPLYFSRRFRRYTDASPSSYRCHHRGEKSKVIR